MLEKEMRGHTDSVTCMALDGNLLFTGSDDCSIRQWELTLNSPSGIVGEVEERKYSIFWPKLFFINFLCFSVLAVQDLVILEKNGLLLSCGYDGKIICWRYNYD